MIHGIVTPEKRAIIHLPIQGQENHAEEIEVVIDTGFNGFLTLPPDIIRRLQPLIGSDAVVILADGTYVELNVYVVEVIWDQKVKEVEVVEAAHTPLLGMSLLEGHEVRLQVIDGGTVEIEALS